MNVSVSSVQVSLGERSYTIEIGGGNLPEAGNFVKRSTGASHAVVLADANIAATHARVVRASLVAAGLRVTELDVAPGESSKCVAQLERLWQALLAANTDRKSVVVAVGGGVIGDLAGFVAASFARGISFVQIPTTLLAQVDSSVGGKVGVNLPGAKNIVGAFWQPRGVLIDTRVLESLPEREFAAGLAEVVKYGVILDADFFVYLEQHVAEIRERQPKVLSYIVSRCCRLKADVVERDEREETGLRAVLNYGHTFAHALEAVLGYSGLLHGEAVSLGMLCASRLAELLGRVNAEFTERQERLLRQLGLPVELPPSNADQLLAAMQHDKKVEHGLLKFVLPVRLGGVELVGNVDPQLARRALAPLSKS